MKIHTVLMMVLIIAAVFTTGCSTLVQPDTTTDSIVPDTAAQDAPLDFADSQLIDESETVEIGEMI